MKNQHGNIGITFLLLAIAMSFGWWFAHITVSEECQRIGAFLVGDKTFYCEMKKT